MRVFIGYDSREPESYWVLAHSIQTRASVPVSITPLILSQLPLKRAREKYQSTEFSFSRFLVPWLCNYEGYALFLDSDMLCLDDIAKLRAYEGPSDVSVVKHDYAPRNVVKFLGNRQTSYPMKCWSSLMLFNNAKCRTLTPHYVDTAPGLDLHQFKWAERIGAIPGRWNHLIGHDRGEMSIVHYTEGGPWFPDYENVEHADLWFQERDDLMATLASLSVAA